jgi:predicted PurR-regulated permease PerM
VDDTLKSVKPWVTFAGGVLVVAVLYWAQAVLVPFALAILLTFVLTPPVAWGTGAPRADGKGGTQERAGIEQIPA